MGEAAGIVTGLLGAGASLFGASKGAKAAEKASDAQAEALREANQMQWNMYQQGRQDIGPWRQAGSMATNYLASMMFPDAVWKSYNAGMDRLRANATQPAPAPVRTAQPAPYTAFPGVTTDQGRTYYNPITGVGENAADFATSPVYSNYVNAARGAQAAQAAPPVTQPAAQQGTATLANDTVPFGRIAGVGNLAQEYQKSPYYDFLAQTGEDAIRRAASPGGHSRIGGQTMKSLAGYSQNLAKTDFDAWYNRLASLAGMGQTSGASSANLALQTGNIMGQNQTAIGAAQAGGYLGRANAWNQGIGNALNTGLNSYFDYQMMNRMLPSSGGSSLPYGTLGGLVGYGASNVPYYSPSQMTYFE